MTKNKNLNAHQESSKGKPAEVTDKSQKQNGLKGTHQH